MKDKKMRLILKEHIGHKSDYALSVEMDMKVEERMRSFKNSLKECDKCGCLLLNHYVKGEPEIREKLVYYGMYDMVGHKEDYIFTPYYCKIHAPKKVVSRGRV